MMISMNNRLSTIVDGQRFTHTLKEREEGYITLLTVAMIFNQRVVDAAVKLDREGIHISSNQGILFFPDKESASAFRQKIEEKIQRH